MFNLLGKNVDGPAGGWRRHPSPGRNGSLGGSGRLGGMGRGDWTAELKSPTPASVWVNSTGAWARLPSSSWCRRPRRAGSRGRGCEAAWPAQEAGPRGGGPAVRVCGSWGVLGLRWDEGRGGVPERTAPWARPHYPLITHIATTQRMHPALLKGLDLEINCGSASVKSRMFGLWGKTVTSYLASLLWWPTQWDIIENVHSHKLVPECS